jgi:glycosyltransferase involved in cell wall biosynthesis
MKVLWIVNITFPVVAKKLNLDVPVGGGWMLDLSVQISKNDNIELAVATYYSGDVFVDITIDNIRYFLLPGGSRKMMFYNKKNENDWEMINSLFPVDIVHLHGSEFSHGLAFINAFPEITSIFTIQGFINKIYEKLYGEISWNKILFQSTLKEIIKLNGTFFKRFLYEKNSKYENQILKKVKYVTGRTHWDMSSMLNINPKLQYFRCNYNLRKEFYESEKWNLEKMTPHTIITGAALSPLKGLHILIEALNIVKKTFPNVILKIPGGKVENGKIIAPNGYMKYINELISKYGLEENVCFLGSINPNQVIEKLLEANVCVVPSAIEGASATLCEAMFLGVPSIASYRGGMTELLRDKDSGFFYDYLEYPVLAQRIMELFNDNDLALEFSSKIINDANVRHDREKNTSDMIELYNEVYNNI